MAMDFRSLTSRGVVVAKLGSRLNEIAKLAESDQNHKLTS